MMPSCEMNHLKGGIDATTLHQLDIDTVDVRCHPGDIVRNDAALVGDDREVRGTADVAQSFQVAAVHRLLDKLEVKLPEFRDASDCFLCSPGRVRVDPDHRVRPLFTNGCQVLPVT